MPETPQLSIDSIAEATQPSAFELEDTTARQEEQRIVIDKQKELEELRNKRYEQKTILIDKYASRLFWFLVAWSILMFIFLFLLAINGLETEKWIVRFSLPEPVVKTLVGSTTIQVIGLFAFVAFYLYKKDD